MVSRWHRPSLITSPLKLHSHIVHWAVVSIRWNAHRLIIKRVCIDWERNFWSTNHMTSCRHIYSIWFKSNQQILSKPQNMETRARFMSGLRTTVDRTTKGAIHAKIAAISPGKETLGNTHKYTKLKQERNPHQYTTIGFAWEIKKCYIIWVCFQQLHKFLWFACANPRNYPP